METSAACPYLDAQYFYSQPEWKRKEHSYGDVNRRAGLLSKLDLRHFDLKYLKCGITFWEISSRSNRGGKAPLRPLEGLGK
jgi:hypothetical protein